MAAWISNSVMAIAKSEIMAIMAKSGKAKIIWPWHRNKIMKIIMAKITAHQHGMASAYQRNKLAYGMAKINGVAAAWRKLMAISAWRSKRHGIGISVSGSGGGKRRSQSHQHRHGGMAAKWRHGVAAGEIMAQ